MRNNSARINMKMQQKRRKLVKIATEFWIQLKIFYNIFELGKKNSTKFNGNVEINNRCSWFFHFDTFDNILAVVKDGEVTKL